MDRKNVALLVTAIVMTFAFAGALPGQVCNTDRRRVADKRAATVADWFAAYRSNNGTLVTACGRAMSST